MSTRHYQAGYQDAYLYPSPSGRWVVEVTGYWCSLHSFDDENTAVEYYEHRVDEIAAAELVKSERVK